MLLKIGSEQLMDQFIVVNGQTMVYSSCEKYLGVIIESSKTLDSKVARSEPPSPQYTSTLQIFAKHREKVIAAASRQMTTIKSLCQKFLTLGHSIELYNALVRSKLTQIIEWDKSSIHKADSITATFCSYILKAKKCTTCCDLTCHSFSNMQTR